MSHVGLSVVCHDAYVMCEWSACHAKSLSVMHHDCNHVTMTSQSERDDVINTM